MNLPIEYVGKTLDAVALRAIISMLNLAHHLGWLRRIALMAEGLCFDIFARDVLAALRLHTRFEVGIPSSLSSKLTLAMAEARVSGISDSKQFLYSVSSDLASRTSPHLSDVLLVKY